MHVAHVLPDLYHRWQVDATDSSDKRHSDVDMSLPNFTYDGITGGHLRGRVFVPVPLLASALAVLMVQTGELPCCTLQPITENRIWKSMSQHTECLSFPAKPLCHLAGTYTSSTEESHHIAGSIIWQV